jgi:ATP-dependent RNA helicase DeaD
LFPYPPAQEFDIVDIAAAAVKLAHAVEAGPDAEHEIPAAAAPEARPHESRSPRRFSRGAVIGPAGAERGAERRAPRDRPSPSGEVARLFIGAGREAGIRPGDLVGAITGEAGINSKELGAIQIADRFSLIEVPASRADDIMAALRATTIRGRKVPVRRDRDQA